MANFSLRFADGKRPAPCANEMTDRMTMNRLTVADVGTAFGLVERVGEGSDIQGLLDRGRAGLPCNERIRRNVLSPKLAQPRVSGVQLHLVSPHGTRDHLGGLNPGNWMHVSLCRDTGLSQLEGSGHSRPIRHL